MTTVDEDVANDTLFDMNMISAEREYPGVADEICDTGAALPEEMVEILLVSGFAESAWDPGTFPGWTRADFDEYVLGWFNDYCGW